MELDAQFWVFVAGPLVALLVGLVTKTSASSGLKAVVNLLLSAIAGVVLQAITNTGPDHFYELALAALETWITSIATHYGFWKPTNISDAVQNATGSFGLGSPPTLEVDPEPGKS